jgi:peptide/nickel transport system ATP-binding protein
LPPLLEIKKLSVDFTAESGITQALQNISFSLNRNEVVALVGESGSGKSVTSLSILQLLPTPPVRYVSGEILFSEDGNSVTDLLKRNRYEMQDIRGNKIAMIFQEPMTSLNPVLTCGDQVTEAIQLHKKTMPAGRQVSAAIAKQKTIDWFAKVKLPDPATVFNRYPHQLSGGQKQRVMIAMAMCCEPSLLICDEPTTALDVTVQKTILQLIKELQQQSGIAVIFITHDLDVVAEIADRAVVMYNGEIVEQNNVKEIFTNPQHPYTKALLACRPVNHKRGKRLSVVSDFLEEMTPIAIGPEVGSQKSDLRPPTFDFIPPTSDLIPHTSVLLSAQNLSVWFPAKKNFLGKALSHTKAVDDVSFDLYKGETLGLVGESGCGKTTLGRALLRLIEPTAGKIIYNNIDLTTKKRDELRQLRKEVQIIFQDPYSSLNPRLTIGSAIAEPMKVHGIFPSEKQRKEKANELLEKVDLKPEHFSRYPHEFSGGQRQRIVIARALALNPAFIVCDESVSALDVSVQAQVLNLLNDLKKELGFTIIFISHDLSVIRYISDRIMVMNQGKIIESGKADDIYFQPQSEYTQKLIAAIPKGIFA